jgi:hypothetical protein
MIKIQKWETCGYSIQITNVNDMYIDELYNSFLKSNILKNAFFDNDLYQLFFYGKNVLTLKTFLKKKLFVETNIVQLLDCLCKQIYYLHNKNIGIYGFQLEDILVIDQKYFLIINPNLLAGLTTIQGKPHLLIDTPLTSLPYFSNPEMIQCSKILPQYIHYKCIYYSLGILLLYCLTGTYLLEGNDVLSVTNTKIEDALHAFYYSKIYWCIKRCLHPDPDKRIILFI